MEERKELKKERFGGIVTNGKKEPIIVIGEITSTDELDEAIFPYVLGNWLVEKSDEACNKYDKLDREIAVISSLGVLLDSVANRLEISSEEIASLLFTLFTT